MRNRKNRRRIIVRAAAAVCEGLEGRRLLTAEVVNTFIDGIFPPNSGTVSLRSAIIAANSSATPTTITFDPNVFATAQTITLNGTQLELSNKSQSTMIIGPSDGVTISANNLSRVFQVDGGVTADISMITITKGLGPSGSGTTTWGGGLVNFGTTTLANVTINSNLAESSDGGGGVWNASRITLIDDAFSNNTAPNGTGGGFFNDNTATLINDTFAGNSAIRGGGIGVNFHSYISTAITNVTISGNTSTISGGGVFINGQQSVTEVTLDNTIIAGNMVAVGGSAPDAEGAFNSLGYNLIGITNGGTGFNVQDLTGTAASPLNPDLGPLANNGGPTQTLLPFVGSPGIDHGNNAYIPSGITTDQAGQPRIFNNTVDIGAVEVQSIGFLAPPSLTAPNEGASSQPTLPIFTWSAVAGANEYRIILATDPAALLTDRSVSMDTDPRVVFNETVAGTSFTPMMPLLNGTPYYWEVIGFNNSIEGTWSAQNNFQTELAAPPPTAPANNALIDGAKPNFSWTAVSGATEYRLVVATQDSNLPTQALPTGSNLAIDVTVMTNSYTPSTELNGNTPYGWEVIGFNAVNGGIWSPILHFTTNSPIVPVAPTLAGPLNLSTDQSLTPTFIWSLVASASKYRLLVASNESDLPTDPTAIIAGPSGVIDVTTPGTSYTPTAPLSVTIPYFWEVIGTNTNGGTWSQISQFTTGDPTIVRTGSSVAVTGTSSSDSASVTTAGTSVTFTIDGLARTFAASKIASTILNTGAGNDTVDISGGLAANVNGGGGDDLIIANQTASVASAVMAASQNGPLGLDQLSALVGGAAPAASGASSVTVMEELETTPSWAEAVHPFPAAPGMICSLTPPTPPTPSTAAPA